MSKRLLFLSFTLFIIPWNSAWAAAPQFTVYPKPRPGLNPAIRDYTTSCPNGRVKVSSVLPRGSRASLNGHPLRAGQRSTWTKLLPGQRIRIQARYKKTSLDYSVRCLPGDFPRLSSKGLLPTSMPLMALASTNLGKTLSPYAFVVDRRGVPIWWLKIPGKNIMDVKGLPGGQIGFWAGSLDSDHAVSDFYVYNNKGQLKKTVSTIGAAGDAHDAQLAADGSWYRTNLAWRENVDFSALGGASHAVWDDQVQQISPSGQLLWSWSSLDHVAPADGLKWYGILKSTSAINDAFDIFHLNSIEQTQDGNLIVSMRHMDAVYKIRKSDGHILWKLGGTATPESLSVLDDSRYPGKPFAGQHDARLQVDGTLTVYDNGTGESRPPRATRWRIDEQARTAQLVEELTDPKTTWSAAGGSARRMIDGSWIVSWSHLPYVRAYSKNHQLLWDLNIGGVAYRAQPVPASYNNRSAMVAGMDYIAAHQ